MGWCWAVCGGTPSRSALSSAPGDNHRAPGTHRRRGGQTLVPSAHSRSASGTGWRHRRATGAPPPGAGSIGHCTPQPVNRTTVGWAVAAGRSCFLSERYIIKRGMSFFVHTGLGTEGFNPRRAVVVDLWTPLRLTRPLGHVATRGKLYSKEGQKSWWNYLRHFLGQVKYQVTNTPLVACGRTDGTLTVFGVSRSSWGAGGDMSWGIRKELQPECPVELAPILGSPNFEIAHPAWSWLESELWRECGNPLNTNKLYELQEYALAGENSCT